MGKIRKLKWNYFGYRNMLFIFGTYLKGKSVTLIVTERILCTRDKVCLLFFSLFFLIEFCLCELKLVGCINVSAWGNLVSFSL